MEIITKGNVKFLASEKLGGVIHGFSLRSGGVSCGDFDSLNVGLRRGDNPFNAVRNIEKCCDGLGLSKENLTLTYQTHTSNVRFVTDDDIGKGFIREWGEGVDGIVTNQKNVPLMCYCADCVPILLYDEKAKLIAALHSGWRGTAGNIVANGVRLMTEKGSSVKDIKAFIGPAICGKCYEVSEAVADCFKDFSDAVTYKGEGKYTVDLRAIVEIQLLNEGLCDMNIDRAEVCTACDNHMFFSHRAQGGRSGLLGGFIQMT